MSLWLDYLLAAARDGEPSVAITVAAIRGSAPREPGATMVVTPTRVLGTIGGGNLEYIAIEQARDTLAGQRELPAGGAVERFVLGTDLSQCCGGVAFLHFEAFPATLPGWLATLSACRDRAQPAVALSYRSPGGVERVVVTQAGIQDATPVAPALQAATSVAQSALHDWDRARDLLWSPTGEKPRDPGQQAFVLMRPVLVGDFRVVLFGAGHVGRALIQVMAPVVDKVYWSDGREEQFPEALPPNVSAKTGDPFELIESQPPGAFYLVMTHSHALDLALCEAIMQRRDHGYLGLIGSVAKRKRFERHLREEGLTDADLERLICPIGVAGITSKVPAVIAIAVAAELLQVREGQGSPSQRSTPRPTAAQAQ